MTVYAEPSFSQSVVDDDPRDGYFLRAVDVDGDGRPDLVASGLTRGEVVWYQNPSWTRRTIASLGDRKPVALDAADLTGNGSPDLVLCHDYGGCMFDCGPGDGVISWLENPGPDGWGEPWPLRHVCGLVATHRVRLGNFTTDGRVQLVALPVVGPQGGAAGVSSPARLMLYDVPDDPANAGAWQGRPVSTADFTVVHGVVAARFPSSPRPDRDSFLLATGEGVSWLGLGSDGAWQVKNIGGGVPPRSSVENPQHDFRGSGNIAVGRIGGRPCAVILAVEPFHGDTLAVYVRPAGTVAPFDIPWERRELRVFDPPDREHDAVGHHVVAADFDGDGDDEFLVAMRGPAPAQGVFYYKLDASGNVLVEKQVSAQCTARIAVADFNGDGRLDFATTAYDTVGYYEIPDPAVRLFTNTFGVPGPVTAPPGGDG